MRLVTLKRRAEFLRVRGGARWSGPSFVLEAKRREQACEGQDRGPSARFGFTVTKRLGGAVVRNRIRRRLKAAVRELGAGHAEADYDYVIVARAPSAERPYTELKEELAAAFRHVHRPPRPRAKLGNQVRG